MLTAKLLCEVFICNKVLTEKYLREIVQLKWFRKASDFRNCIFTYFDLNTPWLQNFKIGSLSNRLLSNS